MSSNWYWKVRVPIETCYAGQGLASSSLNDVVTRAMDTMMIDQDSMCFLKKFG